VVVLASSSFGPILSRNLLYTAITRARRAVVVVGDQAAIAAAVARVRDQERVTGLPVLLQAGADAVSAGAVSEGMAGTDAGAAGMGATREGDADVGAVVNEGAMNCVPTSVEGSTPAPDVRAQFIAPPDTRHLPASLPDDPDDAPPARFLDDDAVYDPMPDDWPD
jgi:hypothetical protein